MAPSHSRQLLVWTLPAVAAILSYLWYYKKKRIGFRSDPGDDTSVSGEKAGDDPEVVSTSSTPARTPQRTFSRSLSGVDSAPIDIVIPPKLKSSKSNPVVISDEDLDKEIEKIKSMKNTSVGTINNAPSSVTKIAKVVQTPAKPKESFEIVDTTLIGSFTPIVAKNRPDSLKKAIMTQKAKSPEQNSLVESSRQQQQSETVAATTTMSSTPSTAASFGKEILRSDDLHRQNSERDSANHSPADLMLASPSLSSISDNHSEGSNDSGKGGSDVVTPPPSRTPGADVVESASLIYEFIISQSLVGKLIGKHGSFVSLIKDKTGAHIVVRKHPGNNKLKVCSIEGSQKEIDSALKLIRDKFPVKRFPDVTLEEVSFLPQISTVPLIPDHLYLKLVEGINNDAIVSCMVSPNHLFLQQPTHPTFPNLNVLNSFMNTCYAEADSPLLPTPIPENTVCVAFSVDSWFRAMILSTDVEKETSYVKFLDYGGYAYVDNCNLRQIRGDFMLLPFQAAECFLANVKPIGDEGWAAEAYTLVAELTKGTIIYTQVADYSPDGVPLVFCYVLGPGPQQYVFLNQELVNQGFAEWLGSQAEENLEEASGLAVA